MDNKKQLIVKILIAVCAFLVTTVLVILGLKVFEGKEIPKDIDIISNNDVVDTNKENNDKENDNKTDINDNEKIENDNKPSIDINEIKDNTNLNNNNKDNSNNNNNDNNNDDDNNNNNEDKPIIYEDPIIKFSISGNTQISFSNIVEILLEGDYIDNTLYYVVTDSNMKLPSDEEFIEYNDKIELTGLEGIYYVWAKVEGKNNNIVYKVSDGFYMKKYAAPEVTYTVDGVTDAKRASTKINVTGDYTKVEYAISESADYTQVTNWIEYTLDSEINIPNDMGDIYVITRVQKEEDLSYVYKVSNVFEMSSYITPEVTYTVDGVADAKKASTKINVTGDYTKVEYAISESADYTQVTNWIEYTLDSEINIPNDMGDIYVITRVQKEEDLSYVYKVSNVFEMSSYITPEVTYTVDGVTDAKKASTKINITGDYTKVEYAISESVDYTQVTNWTEYTLDSEINIPNDMGDIYVITRVQKEEDLSYVYKVSNVFEMSSYITPEVTYTVDGTDKIESFATTRINVTGDYTKVEYAISESVDYTQVTNWIEYTLDSEINIPNDMGDVYVITRVQKEEDLTYIYKVSNVFKMVQYITPEVTYTVDGVIDAKKASTKINVTGDYTKVEYAISESADYTQVTKWIEYTLDSEINIPNNMGDVYVITRVQKEEDLTYIYKVSNVFKMMPYMMPTVNFSVNGSTTQKVEHDVSIILSGDYKDVYYAISSKPMSADILDSEWLNYMGQDLKVSNANGDNAFIYVKLINESNNETMYFKSNSFATLPLITVAGVSEVIDGDPDFEVSNYKLRGLKLNIDISSIDEISYTFITSKDETSGTWNGIDTSLIVPTNYEDTTGITKKSVIFTIKYKNGQIQECIKNLSGM